MSKNKPMIVRGLEKNEFLKIASEDDAAAFGKFAAHGFVAGISDAMARMQEESTIAKLGSGVAGEVARAELELERVLSR